MFETELDTFVKKFHQLWKAGHNAHLDLESHAGVAWVGLRMQLGHAPGPQHHQLHPQFSNQKKDSPSRQRRRARRAAKQNAESVESTENVEGTEEVASNLEVVNADEATTKESEMSVNSEETEAAENATNNECIKNVVEEASTESVHCELCESKFRNTRGLRSHTGHAHKTIPQLDGCIGDELRKSIYTFESNYAKEDIVYTLVKVLGDNICQELISMVKIGSKRSADHLCTVRLSSPILWEWPELNSLQKEVIKSLKLSHVCC